MTKQELLKKIKALADDGVGGEKDTAQRKLDELMRKYNITEKELDEEKLNLYWFTFTSSVECKLLLQTVYKVMNTKDFECYRKKVNDKTVRKILSIRCTQAQSIEIDFLYDFYKRQWKKEADLFFNAFLQKHEIFGTSGGESKEEMDEETERRFWEMCCAISDETPQKQITYKGIN